MPTIISDALLDQVTATAIASPRRRKNHNFHSTDDAGCHRLLNAIEPGSYIAPHCHLDASKGEAIIILRGRLGMVFFDNDGKVTETHVLEPDGRIVGVDIPTGCFHSLVALLPNTVFFEAKAGPYQPLLPAERANWAPAEGEPTAESYHQHLRSLFSPEQTGLSPR